MPIVSIGYLYLFTQIRESLDGGNPPWNIRQAVVAAIHELERYLVGKDPSCIEAHYENMFRDSYWRVGPVLMSAISGIEMALWDILGKDLGVPVYQLLGGKLNDEVKLYANGWVKGSKKPEHFADAAQRAIARGFKALKWDPFGKSYMEIAKYELDFALDCVRAVRDAVGGAGFVVEAEDTIVAIDPYLGGNAKPGFERITPSPISEKDLSNIDFLVSTHAHLDHSDPELINYLAQESTCRFLGPESSIEKMIEAGAPENRITTLTEGAELEIGSLCLKTVVHVHDPYEPHALGIILEPDTLSLLHGGDSHFSDDYKAISSDFSIDIALLSCGLNLYMTIDEMLTAAKDLQCQVFIPMHWDLW